MQFNRKTMMGGLLIILGLLLLMMKTTSVNTGTIFTYFWPTMFVIPLGIMFHWMYFSLFNQRGVGLLVPGGVLLTAGITCQIAMLTDGWSYMWPGFILGVSVGLFELYWFSGRNKYLLIPIMITFVLSAIFFIVFAIGSIVINLVHVQPVAAVLLILLGIGVITLRKNRTH